MKKISIALLPVLIIVIYIFSAMHSFHQVHKSVYYNNKQLSKHKLYALYTTTIYIYIYILQIQTKAHFFLIRNITNINIVIIC